MTQCYLFVVHGNSDITTTKERLQQFYFKALKYNSQTKTDQLPAGPQWPPVLPTIKSHSANKDLAGSLEFLKAPSPQSPAMQAQNVLAILFLSHRVCVRLSSNVQTFLKIFSECSFLQTQLMKYMTASIWPSRHVNVVMCIVLLQCWLITP